MLPNRGLRDLTHGEEVASRNRKNRTGDCLAAAHVAVTAKVRWLCKGAAFSTSEKVADDEDWK